jgi:hypothetical protein
LRCRILSRTVGDVDTLALLLKHQLELNILRDLK